MTIKDHLVYFFPVLGDPADLARLLGSLLLVVTTTTTYQNSQAVLGKVSCGHEKLRGADLNQECRKVISDFDQKCREMM